MAFVSSFTPKLSFPTTSFGSALSVRRPTHSFTIAPTMKKDIAEKVREQNASFSTLEDARVAKEQAASFVKKPGFSDYSETLNGRLAMMGFVIGLITELVSGKGINAQLAMLFSPITNLLGM